MKLKRAIERVPGGMMIVPLVLGIIINTIDQAHLGPVEAALKTLGAPPVDASGDPIKDPDLLPVGTEMHYELLRVGGFTTALFKSGALTLIGMFLVCVGSQIDFAVGARAFKKGFIVTGTKAIVAIASGYALATFFDPWGGENSLLGLSMVAVIAAMSNGNGGMYAALTGQYGNRSDVAALSVISVNDGPFLTLLALGLLGEQFPLAAFAAVLTPIALGFVLGQLDPEIRRLLAPGERLTIPFFAFALGASMSLSVFLDPAVLAGGLVLGVSTVLFTGTAAAALLRLFGERSQIAAFAEASTAGSAVQTPLLVAVAAAQGATMTTEKVELYRGLVDSATAQISISTMTTALLCPLALIGWDRWQRRRGIDGTLEEGSPFQPHAASPS